MPQSSDPTRVQNHLDFAKRMVRMKIEQEQLTDRMRAQEKDCLRKEDVAGVVEKTATRPCGTQWPTTLKRLSEIVARELRAVVSRAINPSFVFNVRSQKLTKSFSGTCRCRPSAGLRLAIGHVTLHAGLAGSEFSRTMLPRTMLCASSATG